ncbi:MAG: ABC transporter substrate-binding protein [Chloroflexi bacterium]|nr:ABC transporter substrate-binding protein [Chloroflexota bacterium]
MSNGISRRDFIKLSGATAGMFLTARGLGQFAPVLAQEDAALATHVTIGNTSIQPNLSPFFQTYFQARQIYDTLIETNAAGDLLPGLAAEWNRTEPTVLEMRLRDDVFFSNGERFTAASVAFTMNHLMTVGMANIGAYQIPLTDLNLLPLFSPTGEMLAPPLFGPDSIEVIDDTHLVIRTARPDPILEKRLSRLFILSEQYMTESGGDLTSGAVGTGYFRVADWVPGERIEFETWEGNWRGNFPLQTATYVTVGDLRTALLAGDIDIAQNLSPDVARVMVDSGEFAVTSKPGLATEVVRFFPETTPALQNPDVRRALNLAVNKEEYNAIIRAGFGRPTTGQLLQPGMDGYNETLEAFPYDPAEAQRLLSEAGYANLELSFGAPNTLRADAEAIAGYLEAIGVRIRLETPDTGTIISEMLTGTERNLILAGAQYSTLGDWTQAMIAIDPTTLPPGAPVEFDNARFVELNQEIKLAQDADTRNALIRENAALMRDEAALLYLSWVDFYFVHTPQVVAMTLNLDNSPQLFSIEMLA